MNFFTTATLIFAGATLINVILQTLRSVITIKGSKITAAIINASAFGFYTIVIKSLIEVDLTIAVIITVLGNLAGVWIALTVLNKFKKDKLWRITATVNHKIDTREITTKLDKYNISYLWYLGEGVKIIDIYSNSQGESSLIKEVLENKAKYHVIEIEKTL